MILPQVQAIRDVLDGTASCVVTQPAQLPGVFAALNFGSSPRAAFRALGIVRPGKPRFCMEYWCGWFDHWGGSRHKKAPESAVGDLRTMYERGDSFNIYMKVTARKNAKTMRKEPSALEAKMQVFLDAHNIKYEFQKILYIPGDKGYIKKFYIADFYIPHKYIIIETDGKFHDAQVDKDNQRTKDIQRYCGNYKVIRWRWHDFESITKMKKLLSILM